MLVVGPFAVIQYGVAVRDVGVRVQPSVHALWLDWHDGRSCPADAISGGGSSVIAAKNSKSGSPGAVHRDQRQVTSIDFPEMSQTLALFEDRRRTEGETGEERRDVRRW